MRLRRSPPPTPVFRTVCSSLTPLLPPRHIKEILTPGLRLHKRGVKRRRGSNWPNCSDVAAGIIYGGAELSRCPRRVITSAASKILISAELMLCLVAQTAAAAAAGVVFRVSADRPSWSATRHGRRRHPDFAQMRCAVTMSTSGGGGDLEEAVERNKFPLQGLSGLHTSGLFSWRERRIKAILLGPSQER